MDSDTFTSDTFTTNNTFDNITLTTYTLVFLACALISFVGVLPILLFGKYGKIDEDQLKNSLLLRCLLNFSVGTLLFDSLCHILPEAISISKDPGKILARTILGVVMFFGIEKFAKLAEDDGDEEEEGEGGNDGEFENDGVFEDSERNCDKNDESENGNDIFERHGLDGFELSKIPRTPRKLRSYSGNFATENFNFKEPISDSNNNMISDSVDAVNPRHNLRHRNLQRDISPRRSSSTTNFIKQSSPDSALDSTNSTTNPDSTINLSFNSSINSISTTNSAKNSTKKSCTVNKINLLPLNSKLSEQKSHKNGENGNKHKTAAKLNLLANIMDNFYHGLSVGTAFLISTKCGFLAAFSILLHEIPHEFGDFAIQLNGGKTIQQAAWDQWKTATSSFLGGMVALCACSRWQEEACNLLLPLSAGGFIYVALSTILADLVTENEIYQGKSPKGKFGLFLLENACTLSGVGIMYWSMQLF